MSTLVQIESAVAELTPEEQRLLLQWLQGRIDAPTTPAANQDALRAFREIQKEMRLTPEAAKTWKSAVAEARR